MQPDELEFWIDVNLPPSLATWLHSEFGVNAISFRDLNLLNASDNLVYKLAAGAVTTVIITTKDIDYIQMSSVEKKPKILLITTGNISNKELKSILLKAFPQALEKFLTPDYYNIIEITK
jgi:predicted nuclease of predicted toxin-antitoxin system